MEVASNCDDHWSRVDKVRVKVNKVQDRQYLDVN